MTAVLLLALVVSSADDLATTRVGNLSIGVPAAWSRSVNGDSLRFEAPSEDASFELSVYPVKPRRSAKKCVDQLVTALGKKGWKRERIGAAPAAFKQVTERASADENSKPFDVRTLSYVGCDGDTKWALTLTMDALKQERFEALMSAIIKSISYAQVGNGQGG